MTAFVGLFQGLLLILSAPLLIGVVSVVKARLQGRQGASIWRPYADLGKLFRKEGLVPPSASPIFRAAPPIVFVVTAVSAFLIPALTPAALLGCAGDFILLIYLLAFARFFLVLGALDGGGAFGGMGGSREALVSALAEVPFLLALTSVAILARTTQLGGIAGWTLHLNFFDISAVHILAFSALTLVSLAEAGRMPVDNPATHLELTMIHEAMVLEQSGPGLAFLEWASALKLNILLSLLVAVFLPWGMATAFTLPALGIALIAYTGKLLALALGLAVVESSMAKMRMYEVPDFLSIGTATSVLAVIFTVINRK